MKYHIERINNRFYVFTIDDHGNWYDSNHDFENKQKAYDFIKFCKSQE